MDADAACDYRDLYYSWEREQWSAGTIDLSQDAREWGDRMPDAERRAVERLVAMSFCGAEATAAALVPLVDAAPTEEQQVFLTTQLADVARHVVFFDRFGAEVVDPGAAGMEERVEAAARRSGKAFRTLTRERLPALAARVRDAPEDTDALVEAIVLCHFVIEAALGATARAALVRYAVDGDLLLGLRTGLSHMARDSARHVAFGVKLVRELVEEPRRKDIVAGAIDRIGPLALAAFGDGVTGGPLGRSGLSASATSTIARLLGSAGVDVAP